ncbi:MAG: amino acid adenylation domain-containing protein, partial [Pseudomonadota bacterium]
MLKTENKEIPFPLTLGQKALWYVHNISPGNCAYNINLAWQIKEEIDTEFLKNAIQTVIERHFTMKTTYFAGEDGELFQKVNPDMPLEFEEVDCRSWSEEELKDVLNEESYRAFDLENGPVSRWTLFSKAQDDHILFFSVHHIATDYTGIVMMFTDLSCLLKTSELPKPKEQPEYDAFVRYSESRTKGPRKKKLAEYWDRQLKESITPLNLPLDLPRPSVPNFRGNQVTFAVPKPLFKKITQLVKAAGISRYTFFMSAFSILLHRYSAQDTILVASPVSCRTPEFRHLSGYCVNPVVLKADLSGSPSVSTFLEDMNKQAFSAFYHKDYPFSVLSKTLQQVREPGVPPVTQVMYNHVELKSFQKKNLTLIDLADDSTIQWYMGNCVWKQVDLRGQTDEFDLILEACFMDEHALIHLMYNENLFVHETIQRMSHHYLTLLESMAADQDMSVSHLSMLTPKETDLLLSTWGEAQKEFEKNACYHTWFEDQVRLTPNAPALYYQDEAYTFQDLEIQANQMANFLKKKGARTETLIGICMDRTPLTIICLLAILKCGAAYVPLDPEYPKERLAYIAEDAGLKFILTQYKNKGRIAKATAQIICADLDMEFIANEPTTPPVRDVALSNACYVIYTSGSTGNPKGVVIEHKSLSALINSCTKIFTREELSGSLSSVSLNFDVSVTDMLVPLALGGTIVLADHPMSVPFMSSKEKIKFIFAVPSTVKSLLQINGIPESVITIAMAGDVLKKDLVNEIFALGHVKNVWNLYGPTEETVVGTGIKMTGPIEKDPTIGKLLAKTEGYILDKYLQPVPIGVPGEFCLGGTGLAREYLNRPDLTLEKFIPHPFHPGERIYRTGDLAAFMPDGQIKYMGRIDFQVKIRGFRIEIGEIEAVIQSHDHVNESIVTVAEDRTGEKILIAYVVLTNTCQLSEHKLRDFIKDRLPAFMVPTYIIFLDDFPLNSNGKIDRKALPEAGMPIESVQPGKKQKISNNTTDIITGIWKKILRISEVGHNDNFFDIGGHSLLMVSLFSMLKEAFDADITLVDLYKYSTIQSQAEFIKDRRSGKDVSEPIPAEPVARAGEVSSRKIAIIGMACRYPGAPDKETYWHNIKNKVESICEFTQAELEENGVPLSMRRHRDFIPRSGWIDDLEYFDADFFNISPREAQIIDPQHRIFMELAWTALEDAGIDLDRTDCLTGIYAGGGQNAYLTNHLNQD